MNTSAIAKNSNISTTLLNFGVTVKDINLVKERINMEELMFGVVIGIGGDAKCISKLLLNLV